MCGATAIEIDGRSAHFHTVSVRQVVARQVTLVRAIKLLQQFRDLAHFADAEAAVAVGVEQAEQAAALIGNAERHRTGRNALLQLLQVVEVGIDLLFGQLAVAVAIAGWLRGYAASRTQSRSNSTAALWRQVGW
jgi:hypothetical protein